MDIDIAAIEKRAAAATEGPWERENDALLVWTRTDSGNGTPLVRADNASRRWGRELNWDNHVANMEFIAHARQDVPELLCYIRLLEKRIQELEKIEEGRT